MNPARSLVADCQANGCTIGTAESVTAGLVSSAIADIPGCSTVYRGGVVSYATSVKRDVLGIPERLLVDVVTREVAEAMARSACRVLDADVGIATTGVAGPDSLHGHAPGTAWIAVHDRRSDHTQSELLALTGDRADVRAACCTAALSLAARVVGNSATTTPVEGS